MKTVTRIAVIIAGLLLIAVLYLPLWSIELVAPQYPEGLELIINPDGLAGNVDIINGLNHYIGMKTLHNQDFPEFKILPWIIIIFAAAFILTGIAGKMRGLKILTFSFILFGVIAMVDFWRWEYNYGHDLDPNAAIQVPGMAYQPPLIGYKQLLNFAAYSMPDQGGWIFVAAGLILTASLAYELWLRKKTKRVTTYAGVFTLLAFFSSCASEPEAINLGKDNCDNCKMTISDERFGAIWFTQKGRTYKFDDTNCLYQYIAANPVVKGTIFLRDYCAPHAMLPVEKALILKSEALHSPMGANTAAFSNNDSLQFYQQQTGGTMLTFPH